MFGVLEANRGFDHPQVESLMATHRMISLLSLLAIALCSDVSNAQEEPAKHDIAYLGTRQAIEDSKTLKYTLMSFQKADDDSMDVGHVDHVEHRTPSFWRHTALDEQGKVKSVHIVDNKGKKQLYLDMKSKTATWLEHPIHVYGDVSMLKWMANFIKDMPTKATGQRETSRGKADVFESTHVDLWFDSESKDLVGLSVPISDPEFRTRLSDLSKTPTRFMPGKSLGRVYKDIEYGVEFNEDRFEMKVPEGFQVVEPPVAVGQSHN